MAAQTYIIHNGEDAELGALTATSLSVNGNAITGKQPQTVVSADGAITIPTKSTTFVVTKAGVAAMTLADPTAGTHDGVRLTFLSATANAHTLSNAAGSGFNAGGAAADVGTFGGAKGDNIVVEAYQGVWYVVSKTNVTLG
jgi:hypothetical protein